MQINLTLSLRQGFTSSQVLNTIYLSWILTFGTEVEKNTMNSSCGKLFKVHEITNVNQKIFHTYFNCSKPQAKLHFKTPLCFKIVQINKRILIIK